MRNAQIVCWLLCVLILGCIEKIEVSTRAKSPAIFIPSDASGVVVQATRDFESASFSIAERYPAESFIRTVTKTVEALSWNAVSGGDVGMRGRVREWQWKAAGDPAGAAELSWQAAWTNGRGSVVKYTLHTEGGENAAIHVTVLLDREWR